jgi:YfiH family protein
MSNSYLYPPWPLGGQAQERVKTCITTRFGGRSLPPYDEFNLALHVGDDLVDVLANRSMLQAVLPSQPVWLTQVHGVEVFDADQWHSDHVPVADAAVTTVPRRVLGVMTADCLPVLLCDWNARVVGVAHAGWRGLCAGVVEQIVSAMLKKVGDSDASNFRAYLGPAIGPTAFEVGSEVRAAFIQLFPEDDLAFEPLGKEGKYLADLYKLAKQRLARLGITEVASGAECTYLDQRFYSYRRTQQTGRMASFIWLNPS